MRHGLQLAGISLLIGWSNISWVMSYLQCIVSSRDRWEFPPLVLRSPVHNVYAVTLQFVKHHLSFSTLLKCGFYVLLHLCS